MSDRGFRTRPTPRVSRGLLALGVLSALLHPAPLTARPPDPGPDAAATGAPLRALMRRGTAATAERLGVGVATPAGNSARVPLLLQLRPAEGAPDPRRLPAEARGEEGLRLTACVGNVCAGWAPVDTLERSLSQPWIGRVEHAGKLRAIGAPAASAAGRPLVSRHPSPPRPAASALGAHLSPRTLSPGAGVLVAFVDTGVDVFHPDFRNPDGTTRIRALLDLSHPGDEDGDGELDGAGPYGGTEWSEADINAALPSGTFPSVDPTGHGTHGLSVAAGGGQGLSGIAPGADLLVVKATRKRDALEFEAVDLIAAMAWVEQKATELSLPVVLNLSLGTDLSSHDGRSLEEMAVDQFGGAGRSGRVVVVAAGNAASHSTGVGHHLKATVTAGKKTSHTLQVPAYTPRPGPKNDRLLLDLWHDGSATVGVEVVTPSGQTVSAPSGSIAYRSTPEGDVLILNEAIPVWGGGGAEALVIVDDYSGAEVASGDWTVRTTGQRVHGRATYDLWVLESSTLGSLGTRPGLVGGDGDSYIGKPGGAFTAITVGSHAEHTPGTRFLTSWTDVTGRARVDDTALAGGLSDYSSTGPMRDGRIKPELTAPGERTLGAVSKDAYPGRSETSIYRYHPWPEPEALIVQKGETGAYGLLQGTSFAAPVVTGLAARVLEQHPTWDGERVRNALVLTAKKDVQTGTVPNAYWGWGKADLGLAETTPIPGTLRIVTPNLPVGHEGRKYSGNLTATGGTRPYTWSLQTGPLPNGLTVDPLGRIVGTPKEGGVFTIAVRVNDAEGGTDSRTLELRIKSASELEIVTEGLPPATLDTPYTETLQGSGGTQPYAWTVDGGSLPPGIALTSDGIVGGTPSEAGTTCFTVRLGDAAAAHVEKSFCLTVDLVDRDSWTQRGLVGATVTALQMLPSDPNVIYAGTDGNGLYVTRNQGLSWARIMGLPRTRVTQISLSPLDENVIYVGTQWNGGFRSADGGRTWTSLMPPGYPTAYFVKEDISDPNRIWYGTEESRWYDSPDGGVTWAIRSEPIRCELVGAQYRDLVQDPTNPDRIYLATRERFNNRGEIFFSTDHGGAWDFSGQGLWGGGHWICGDSPGGAPFERVWLDPLTPTTIYAGPAYGNFMRSVDQGMTWTALFSAFPASEVGFGPFTGDLYVAGPSIWRVDRNTLATSDICSGRPGWQRTRVYSIAVNPRDENNIVAGTSQGVFVTNDGGASWEQRARGMLAANILDADSDAERLVVLTPDGVFESRLGGSAWSRLSVPAGATSIRLGHGGAEGDVYAASSRSVYRLDESGLCTRISDGCLGASDTRDWIRSMSVVDRGDRARIYLVTTPTEDPWAAAVIQVSEDRGKTWTTRTNPNTGRIWDFAGRLWIGSHWSDDDGLTWNAVSIPAGTGGTTEIFRRPSDGSLWASNLHGFSTYDYEARHSYLMKSLDSGQSLSYVNGLLQWNAPPNSGQLKDIVFRGNELLFGTIDKLDSWGGVFRPNGRASGTLATNDDGLTFTQRSVDLPLALSVNRLLYDSTKDLLIAGTAGAGVFQSWDGGQSWQEANSFTTVASTITDVLSIDASTMVVASGGYGVYVTTDGGTTFTPTNQGLAGGLDVRNLTRDADGVLWAATAGGLYFQTVLGGTWTKTTVTGLVTDVEVDGQGTAKRIWATVNGLGVARSEDGGTTWALATEGLASLELTSLEIEDTGVAKRIWATTKGGDGAYVSDDGGVTWQPVEGIGLGNRDLNDLKVEQGVAKRIWATTDDGVWVSSDGGRTWQDASAGLPRNVPLTSLTFDPASGEALVSANHPAVGGVYRGGNATGYWSSYSAGLGDRRVNRVSPGATVTSGGLTRTVFHAGTDGGGLYSTGVTSGAGPSAPAFATAALPAACARAAYTSTLAVTGGEPPYAFGVVSGSLPPGVSLGPDGRLAGSAVEGGDFVFQVRMVDQLGQKAEKTYLLHVEGIPAAPVIEADREAGAGSTDRTARVKAPPAGAAFAWEIDNGTVTSGQGTAEIRYTAGGVGVLTLRVTMTTAHGCGSARGEKTVTVVGEGEALRYYTLTPCRVVNTRRADFPPGLGAPSIGAVGSADRSFALATGSCGLPGTAKAVALNVTVADTQGAGYVTVYPGDGAVPATSTVNFATGQTKANGAIVRLGPGGGGTIKVRSGSTSPLNILVDVLGYFQ